MRCAILLRRKLGSTGLAFPFVNLAIAIGLATGSGWLEQWLLKDVIWKLAIGFSVGLIVGKLLGWLIFHMPNRAQLSKTGDGFVALGITLVAYTLTELAGGYGFLAVFIAATGVRGAERDHEYHERLHDFIEQLERLLMMLLLVLFGGALSSGLLLSLTWPAVLYAALAILIVRPVVGWLSLLGAPQRSHERVLVSFFEIRGLGSAYYLAYGLNHGKFENPDLLWSVAGFIILMSIMIHGTTVTPAMRCLDRRAGRALQS